MVIWLSEREQRLVAGAEEASAATPIPHPDRLQRRVSAAAADARTQKRVEARIVELADANAGAARPEPPPVPAHQLRHGGGVRRHERDLRRPSSRSAGRGAPSPSWRTARAQGLAGQFIFDVQTHFVRDDFDHKELLGLAEFASQHWNPVLEGGGRDRSPATSSRTT